MCTKMIYLCFVLLLSLAGFVKGSCLEYGHSCWGAHGKRSGGKIYRSIDGSESQQSETNRDIPLAQDKLKPRELFGFLLDRNGRINLEDAKTPLETNSPNNENENMFDASEQRLRRKLKNAIRKGAIFNYQPKSNDYIGSTESNAVRRNSHPLPGSSSEYYQIENYPSLNLEMEYLDLK